MSRARIATPGDAEKREKSEGASNSFIDRSMRLPCSLPSTPFRCKGNRRTIRASITAIDSLCRWSFLVRTREKIAQSEKERERERSETKEVDISHSFPSMFVCILNTVRKRTKISSTSQNNWSITGNKWLDIDPTGTIREDNQMDCCSKLSAVDEQIYRSTRFYSNVSLSLS